MGGTFTWPRLIMHRGHASLMAGELDEAQTFPSELRPTCLDPRYRETGHGRQYAKSILPDSSRPLAYRTVRLRSTTKGSVVEVMAKRTAWNEGTLIGQKPPLKPKDIWAIRIHLQNAHAVRDLAMFNLAIDSKLRGCDLVSLRVRDVTHGTQVLPRAMVKKRNVRHVEIRLTGMGPRVAVGIA